MADRPHREKGASNRRRVAGAVVAALPIVRTLRHYSGSAARFDLLAGLGVAAILVPQGMAYGQLAGLKPVVGLYSALGAMVGFAPFSRTRQLIVGPEAALAALSAITVGGVAHGDAARALALSGGLALLFLTPLLTDLPVAGLAAVVIAATVRLFDFRALLELWRLWRSEAVLAVITLIAVAVLDVLTGLAIAVALNRQPAPPQASPLDAVLAVQPSERTFRDITHLDEPMLVDELIIYRFDAPLCFANASMFRQRVLGLARRKAGSLQGVLVDAGAIFYVDSTAIAMPQQLREDLHGECGWGPPG
jgi:MFS superfamily sulfate permease-like transporter